MKFVFNPLSAQFELQANNCGPTTNPGTSPVISSTPTIQNISVMNANTETMITIPNGTKKILIKVRNYASSLKLSYASGSATYITINTGCSYAEENILTITASNIIYIQSTKPNVVIECLTWT